MSKNNTIEVVNMADAVHTVIETIEAPKDRVELLRDEFLEFKEYITEKLKEILDDVDEVQNNINNMTPTEDLEYEISSMQSTVDSIEADVEDLQNVTEAADEAIGDLYDKVDKLENRS